MLRLLTRIPLVSGAMAFIGTVPGATYALAPAGGNTGAVEASGAAGILAQSYPVAIILRRDEDG